MTKPEINDIQQSLLKRLPGVDVILDAARTRGLFPDTPKAVLTASARKVIAELRRQIIEEPGLFPESSLSEEAVLEMLGRETAGAMALNLDRVVNATGVVVHTNLGRSLLSDEALAHVETAAGRYSNLEFDLKTGRRGSRYSVVEELICEISGAESALVVNNNAAAVLLSLDTIASGKEVLVSRGELVEIGGSFRIPDVMARSGALLKEVGTTNRTHLFDYQDALSENTGLLLKVHTSNFAVVGFTSSVSLAELAELGKSRGIPVMEDLGSGTFVDFSKYGLMKEPTVRESVAAGADIVTFSGDKLLGGPQAGIIAGNRQIVDRIKKNPLNRALRIDKLTLAALESTLREYRDEAGAVKKIPTLRMITCPKSGISEKAEELKNMIETASGGRVRAEAAETTSRTGGGALPLLELPSMCVAVSVEGFSAKRLETALRANRPPVIARIEENQVLLDMRTVQPDELEIICSAVTRILREGKNETSC